jgi:hypothetical protein
MNGEARMQRIAALGAVGVSVGVLIVFLAFVYLTTPRPVTGGMDWTHARTTWISVGVLVLAIIAVHLAIARQLWRGTQLHP